MKKLSLLFILFAILAVLSPADNTLSLSRAVQVDNSEVIVFEKWIPFPNKPGWGYRIELWLINSDGSGLRQLTYDHRDTDPTWSPDKQHITFARDNRGIYIIKYDYTEYRRVSGRHRCFSPQWLKDNRILYSAHIGPEEEFHLKWRLCEASLDTFKERIIDVKLPGVFSVKVSPDELWIAFSALQDNIYIADTDGIGVRPVGKKGQLMESYPLEWYPDGEHLLIVQDTHCLKLNIKSAKTEKVGPVAECNMSWSPDHSRIVYEFNNQIWLMDASGRNKRLLAKPGNGSQYKSPDW